MRRAGHAWAGLWYGVGAGAGRGVCGAGVGLAALRPVRRAGPQPEVPAGRLRLAVLSLAMLVLLPAYQSALLPWLAPDSAAARIGFSHAYYGAIRHAITVGFVSLMIVGVASKVVPTLNGVDGADAVAAVGAVRAAQRRLRPAGRRPDADRLRPGRVPRSPASAGCWRWPGLALWGGHLWAVMGGFARARAVAVETAAPVVDDAPLVAANRVGDVLDRYPHLLDVFLAHGFAPLANPVVRRVAAGRITIAAACRRMGVDAGAARRAERRPRVPAIMPRGVRAFLRFVDPRRRQDGRHSLGGLLR